MRLKDIPFFFLDLQTTGAKPGQGSILEIAWADEKQTETYLVAQPEGASIPFRIQALTGIREEDLAEALPLAQVLERLAPFLAPRAGKGQRPWAVIHFAQFEKPFLLEAFDNTLPFDILCTHEIAKRLMPNLPSRGIKGLAGYFGYNAGELKRAPSHIEATKVIWKGLVEALEKEGVTELPQLLEWLQATPKKTRTKYEYPLAKEKRLSLPDQPGVYRMVSRWGEVLYVGKATSLHSRVNSYFRGQKNRDPRKLEMLTQTWDLIVTPCGSPLESALMETDEIKRLNPRYNISLKTGKRALVFYNRDFTSHCPVQDEEHPVGPFPNALVLDSMLKLAASLREKRFDPDMFHEKLDPELLKAGFLIFCQRHHLRPDTFASMRSILALGLWWQRQEEPDEVPEAELSVEELSEDLGSDSEEATPEDVADKFERHFVRAGRALARARKLTRLLNADIEFQMAEEAAAKHLSLRAGRIQADSPQSTGSARLPWRGLSVDTYDRMSILQSELQKIVSHQGRVWIHKIPAGPLENSWMNS